ncbi:hypothetical protein DICPUDRAFT_55773 [Dictyostelium purpureum]|uniref:Uncharacterized protein n=1 Tax=Dictyostelium purpureum TaxID=5786 RepID=F0ZNJ7_DICPU|nr:uncharacterized protein DICPUDRAFT_55773 [Dictyostelium purpureum]EGC34488.1 hypothetical protein DICPUDRAFT_55773 [Dictyostelium purpureum]|eukprot:XP_003288977.1 hypothetical protein DICPUDRAFT_55773 [Dictyostelium purpureum]
MKFLSFDLFNHQNCLPSDEVNEPIDVIPALNDFLISTKSGEIIHYSINATNECTVLNRFNTQNQVIKSINYIASNDSILTLEKDGEIGVVRIYQNWRLSNQNYSSPQLLEDGSPLSSSPSMVDSFHDGNSSTHSNSTSNLASLVLNVTKIPVPSSVVSISSCPITSRVIVSTDSSVSIWTAVYQNYPLLNYFEKILDIHIKGVTQVGIYENYLAYATLNEAKVLSLSLSYRDPFSDLSKQQQQQQQQKQQQQQQNNQLFHNFDNTNKNNIQKQLTVNNGPSEIIEDEHYFEVTFDQDGNPTGKNQLSTLEIKGSSNRNSNGISEEVEVFGPISDIEHGINVNSESGFTLLASTLLLSKRFHKDDEIHTIFLLPDASSNNSILLEPDNSTPAPTPTSNKSPIATHRNKSIGQMNIQSSSSISSSKLNKSRSNSNLGNSYLSNNSTANIIISSNGNNNIISSSTINNPHANVKNLYMRCVVSTSSSGYVYNISKPSKLSAYNYANETVSCFASQSFLYTITTEGLQTWTLRSCEGANDGDVPPPCGLGLQYFPYLTKGAVAGDHLLILSKHNTSHIATNNKISNLMKSPSKPLSPNPKSKQPEPKLIVNEDTTLWGLYLIRHTPLQTLYNDILQYAIKYKESNDEVYHKLLLEGHFLLQSKLANQHTSSIKMNDMASLMNFGIERKNYQLLLKRSSSYLGEFFYKRSATYESDDPEIQHDYMRAALWYSSSDTEIETVFEMLVKDQKSHLSLIYYLENVLYDPNSYEVLLNKEELSDKILNHYFVNSPHRLPLLILESSISSYSQELAIQLLREIAEKGDFDSEGKNRVYFALGLLYLDQNKFQNTIDSFNEIPTEALINLCLKNPKLLAPPGESEPTEHLCKILRKSTPWGLLEITIQLVIQKEITPEFGLKILLKSSDTFETGILDYPISYHKDNYDLDSLLIKIYLEWFLFNNFKSQQQQQQSNKNKLNNNSNNSNSCLQQSASTTNQQQVFSNSNSFSHQDLVPSFIKYLLHLYVKDIQRFVGEDEQLFHSLNLDVKSILNKGHHLQQKASPQQQRNIKSSQQQLPQPTQPQNIYCNQWISFHFNSFLNIPQWLSKLPPFSTGNNYNPSAQNEVGYLLKSFYYRKLQSILSINIIKDFEFMDNIENIFNEDQSNIMLLSLKLACLPLLGQIKEAIELVLNNSISVILDYSLHFCKELSDWSIVLDSVLKKYQLVDKSLTKEKETIVYEYEQLLSHLSEVLDPDSFLHLLPPNGKIDYFLSFIEKSFSNCQAKLLKQNLSSSLLEME